MKITIGCAALVPFAAILVLHSTVLAQPPSKSVWDGVYTQEQADRGKTAFATECASCHGSELNGGDMAPPLSGGEFMSGWDGLTVGDLFERIRVSIPQNALCWLAPEQNGAILAFVLSYNKFPTGTTELASETSALKQIKFESKKSPGR